MESRGMILDRFMMSIPWTMISGKGAELFITITQSSTIRVPVAVTSMESDRMVAPSQRSTVVILWVSAPRTFPIPNMQIKARTMIRKLQLRIIPRAFLN